MAQQPQQPFDMNAIMGGKSVSDTGDKKKEEDDPTRPACPVCTNLAFNAMIGLCGHTVCEACMLKLQGGRCPLCRKMTSFHPNYMVLEMLDHPRFAGEVQQLAKDAFGKTDKGRIQAIASQYENWHVVANTLNDHNTLIMVGMIEPLIRRIKTPKQMATEFCIRYGVEIDIMLTSCPAEGQCFIGQSTNAGDGRPMLIVRAGTVMFMFFPRVGKKDFTVRPLPPPAFV